MISGKRQIWIYVNVACGILTAPEGTLAQRVQIYPSPRADCILGGTLRLTCSNNGTGSAYFSSWSLNSSSKGTVRNKDNSCTPFGQIANETLYTVECIGNEAVHLIIKNMQLQQHGDVWSCYQPIDGQQYVSNSTTVFVRVRVSTVMLNSPSSSSVTVAENSSVEFRCTTSLSRPAPTVSWYIDGDTATTNDDVPIWHTNDGVPIWHIVSQSPAAGSEGYVATTGSLTYTPSRTANGKYIFCESMDSNGHTILSNRKIRLNVIYKPESGPQIQGYTNNTAYSVLDSKQQTLTCAVTGGNPLPSLSWSCFTGKEQDLSSDRIVSKRWIWKTSSSGTCICTSTQLGVSEAVILNVTILTPPTSPVFLLHSQTVQGSSVVNIIRDSSASIICSATSSPSPDKYTWTYDGQSTALSHSASLYPSQITADGRYWCQVGNTMTPSQGQVEVGNNSSSVIIQRLYAPTVIPFNVDPVVEESTLFVECKTRSGNPATTTYSWKRKLSSSSDNTWQDISGSFINGSQLLITNINRNDAGTYKCTASNVMQPTAEQKQIGSNSQKFILDVLYKPSVASFFFEGHKGQQHVTFDEYDIDVHITCEVESNPPSTIQIMFDGAVLKEASDKKVLTFVRSTIECLHSGIYSCQARNQHGQNSSENIMAYVRCSPRPIGQVQQNTSSSLYFPVTLRFAALAYPEPGNKGFKWHKLNVMRWIPLLSNKALKIASSGSESNLTIFNVSQQDYGQYRVTVTNEIGSYEQYLFVEEEDVQKEPFTKSKCKVETDKTGLIVGICFGLLSAVLTAYSTIVTIALKRKAPRKGTPSKDESKTQATYTNVAKGSTSGSSKYDDTSVKLYTDLARFSTDDKTTYDVIQKI